MSLIDDIKRDREAGTPGPWRLDYGDPDEWPNNDPEHYHSEWEIYSPEDQVGGFMGYTPFYPWQSDNEADPRRIARVPDLEAAILAADELADAIDRDNPRAVGFALAAYRKATGETQ